MPAKAPPIEVATSRTRLTEAPIARAASTLSPASRTIRPQRVFVSAQAQREGEHDADHEQVVDLQRLADLRDARSTSRGRCAPRLGALGWMKGLPRKKARPVPNSISAMPVAMSLTRGSWQMRGMQRAQQQADAAPRPARRATASRSRSATP